MNAKFEWLGLSVARKHVYFYTLLITASLCAHTVKDSLQEKGLSPQVAEQIASFNNNLAEAQVAMTVVP